MTFNSHKDLYVYVQWVLDDILAVCLPSFNVKSSAESDVVELNQCWCGQLMFTLHSFKDDRHAKWGSFGWMPPCWGEARASDFEELIQTLAENFNVCRMTLQHIIPYAWGLHKLTWVAGQIRVRFNFSKVQELQLYWQYFLWNIPSGQMK